MSFDEDEDLDPALPDHADVRTAMALARAAHLGQADKAGRPYLGHPIRVARSTWHATGSIDATVTALLHDVIEDSSIDERELENAGISRHVIDAVHALSRKRGETPERYYARVGANRLAVVVKQHDIADNSAPERLAMLDQGTRERLERKYAKAKLLLDEHSQPDAVIGDIAGWMDMDRTAMREVAMRAATASPRVGPGVAPGR